jgi:mitochondrial fission protein ELM1
MTTFRSERHLVIWRLIDGKPGHEKQTLGLAHALLRKRPGEYIDIATPARSVALMQWIQGRFPAGNGLPAPEILLAAGHATHFALLAARRAHGGKAVVLMKPSLPLSLFDLCVIPDHDNPPMRGNVIATQGALNCVVPSEQHEPSMGLILLGGPSPHFHWSGQAIVAQIVELIRLQPEICWTLTTSRRTPPDFLATLPNLDIKQTPAEETPPGWLEQQLQQTGSAWVTPDSVSMLYEALTSGCSVGVFDLPAVKGSKVAEGVLRLQATGCVITQAALDSYQLDAHPPQPFNEADRCASLIIEKEFQ